MRRRERRPRSVVREWEGEEKEGERLVLLD
jgi:hypothetical protein